MKIGIITGSHRADSQSERVGHYVESALRTEGHETYFLSLGKNPLPLWDEGVWAGAENWKTTWGPIATQLQGCHGFVVVSPEWSGMVPPGLKNFFLLCSTAEVGHKPGLIIAVSSGVGGSYPVNELRISSYKNTRLCYIPEHVIIRGVEKALHGDQPADARDAETRGRIAQGLHILTAYAQALIAVRESGAINYKDYPYGM